MNQCKPRPPGEWAGCCRPSQSRSWSCTWCTCPRCSAPGGREACRACRSSPPRTSAWCPPERARETHTHRHTHTRRLFTRWPSISIFTSLCALIMEANMDCFYFENDKWIIKCKPPILPSELQHWAANKKRPFRSTIKKLFIPLCANTFIFPTGLVCLL